jgi:hypothetical protein
VFHIFGRYGGGAIEAVPTGGPRSLSTGSIVFLGGIVAARLKRDVTVLAMTAVCRQGPFLGDVGGTIETRWI